MKNFFSVLAPIAIALQETWFLPTDCYNFNLPNYSLYRQDDTTGQRRQGGVALYVNNDYTHHEIILQTDLQASASTIYLNGRNIDVCSLYIPPRDDIDDLPRQLNNLVTQFRHPYLILGDFNSHSPTWWNEQRLDARGKKIEDFIASNNLVLLNTDLPTFFSLSYNTESAIDLSLCSPLLGTWFDWKVDSDIHDSDHYPIYLQTTFQPMGTPCYIPRWKLSHADWNKFTVLCENSLTERFQDPDQEIHHITETIVSIAKRTIPLTQPPTRSHPVPWWSPAVRQAIAKRKRAFRAYLHSRTQQTLILRNKQRSITRKVIRTAKRMSWRHFLSNFSSSTPLSRIWQFVRRLTGKRAQSGIPTLRVPGNPVPISDPTDVVNAIAASIAKNSSNDNYRAGFIQNAQRHFITRREEFFSDNEEAYNTPFSIAELKAAITASGNTSVGPDNLHYSFFRHLSDISLHHILHTFNGLWETHCFPNSWKDSIVLALPKPGKSRHHPDNYRPIALTSCFGKLMERMVAKRLTYTLEQQQFFSQYQCGFRRHHSTIDHLIRLETDIRKGFKSKKHTTAVFLDIRKAYDMVHRPAVVNKLHKAGIRGHMAYYLVNFLEGSRHFRVRCRSLYSDSREMENGLPQGSCLSPILFNIFINDLFEDISAGISYSLFADDSAIWCTDGDYDVSIRRLQSCLSRLENWSRTHGLEFSAEKSAAIIFTRSNIIQPSPHLIIHNSRIPFVNHFKFLGVVLDRRLSMAQHTKHIKTKCNSRLNLFRCLTSSESCADRVTLLRLYTAIVLPIIEYGAVVYAGGKKTSLHSLEAIQNSFLRIALGAIRTSPVTALQVEANISPLYIRRKELTLRYITKIKQFPHHASRSAIDVLPNLHHNYIGPSERRTGLTIASRATTYISELQIAIPNITTLPSLEVAPWTLHPRVVSFLSEERKVDLSRAEIQQAFLIFRDRHRDYRFIYTDGSKTASGTGNAMVVEGLTNITSRLPDDTSVYLAELHAILLALRYIQHRNLRKVCICSDSRSALASLQHIPDTQHILFDAINIHQELVTSGTDIFFLWIPGHSGISGNEWADEAARHAIALPNITNIPISHHSIRSFIHQHSRAFWQKSWRDDPDRTQLHEIKPDLGMWSSSSRKCRLEEKTLARLRLGHTSLTHSYIFTRSPRPRCTTCDTTLTVKHLLLHCDQFRIHRDALKFHCAQHHMQFSLDTLLGNENPELTRLLFSFLRNTNLLARL